jgi:hypothetical protein
MGSQIERGTGIRFEHSERRLKLAFPRLQKTISFSDIAAFCELREALSACSLDSMYCSNATSPAGRLHPNFLRP